MRYRNFQAADAIIKAHNANGTSKFTMGHNQLSSMTEDEKKMLRGDPTFWSDHKTARRLSTELGVELGAVPSSVNWVTAGAVNPIKNQ